MGSGTEIGRVRGLGSAHHGPLHWWHQKITAGTNLLFMAWLMISIARLPGYDYASVRTWLSSAWVAVPMLLLIASVFYHFRLGLQVVIDDYVHSAGMKVFLMLIVRGVVIATIATCVFALIRIASV